MNPLCRLVSIALLVTSSGFADNSSYLQEKCRRIKVPSVELEKTPFREAIQYLQQRARELDETEPDIQRKGVNIILLREIQRLHQASDAMGISMTAENLSLGALLTYAAQLGGAVVDVHPEAIVIGTAEEIQELRKAMGLADASGTQSTGGHSADPATKPAEQTQR